MFKSPKLVSLTPALLFNVLLTTGLLVDYSLDLKLPYLIDLPFSLCLVTFTVSLAELLAVDHVTPWIRYILAECSFLLTVFVFVSLVVTAFTPVNT